MKRFATIAFFLGCTLVSSIALAQDTTTLTSAPVDSPIWYSDDPIVAALDSMWALPIFSEEDNSYQYAFGNDSIPTYSDSILTARFAEMDRLSPFEFQFNEPVKAYCNLYLTRRRKYTSKLLGLSQVYFPLFEEKLMKYDLPLELKYLAIVESGLKSGAKSRVGAMGLWQFMYPTGKMLGLEVDNYRDERCDPYLATEAACQYLRHLHNMYGDWQLALAAYNAGPGNVNKAIRRAGGGKLNYWQVRPYLPKETQGYVPAFFGVAYTMTYADAHNIPIRDPDIRYFEYDTVHICHGLTFTQLSEALDVEYDIIKFLNPVYHKDIVPHPPIGGYQVIALPRDVIGEFVLNESYIYTYVPANERIPNGSAIVPKQRKIHVVKQGEYLSKVARNYGCSAEELRVWNNLKSNQIKPGQQLLIYVATPIAYEGEATPATKTTSSTPKSSTAKSKKPAPVYNGNYVYHVVKKGDTLWDIANQYNISLATLRSMNHGLDEKHLKTGQKIRIREKA